MTNSDLGRASAAGVRRKVWAVTAGVAGAAGVASVALTVAIAGTATGQGLAELAARTKKEPGIS